MEQYAAEHAPTAVLGALVILKIVFDFVKERQSTSHAEIDDHMAACERRMVGHLETIKEMLRVAVADLIWLRDIHDKKDLDGVPVWYNRRSLENKIEKLTETMTIVSSNLNELVNDIRDFNNKDPRS
jgi:hypothetical protein